MSISPKKKRWENRHLTLCQIVNFSTIWISSFYRLGSRFFALEYRKRHFPGPVFPKKKSWRNGHFWTKTMGYLLWKNVNFSTFWTSIFYSLERRFFAREYRKRYFPGLYCLKKKVGKMAIFGPKPWVNPFAKMSIFRLFELLVFTA